MDSVTEPWLQIHHDALGWRCQDVQPSDKSAGVWRRGNKKRRMHQPRRQTNLGGKGYGKLKLTTIDSLEAYYGLAVQPGPHRVNVRTHLSAEVARHVKPVYARLAHDDLLSRCLLGKTQNVNESLHSKVWTKCPKTNFVGLERVLSATCSSVAEFNCGVESSMRYLCEVMQVPSGAHLLSSAQKADRQRLRQAKRQKAAATKEARRSRRFARRAVASASTDYAAGAF